MKTSAQLQMIRNGRPASGLASLIAKLVTLRNVAPASAAQDNSGIGGIAGAGIFSGLAAVCTSAVRTAKRHESRLIASKAAGFNWGKRYNIRGVSPQVAGG